ncbi:LysR family transcriptional regulator [Pseudomonas typographi]|uniref:LysR family transcriptional regulator n=1 Tax=Pseudomonas typographi TaxID=2715964 RepID=A0ABR7Z1G2_9PSED|nr:LysR family transcriptional regulator [Pseudomonas typographi]MBD1551758.1 LysR family transcriptional regulator [Pseudomonas typographi]MBD1586987.1 LysR family transcriptional regulator [Pseudomonas typographi]MBD1599227.1 LysR family transcriptional regulator [Pseudomonas typographi]
MLAPTHYPLEYHDLRLVLALVRGGSLAKAADLLGQDVSTVFRAIQRLEKALGTRLFDKPRSGYSPTPLAEALAAQAQQAEQALARARQHTLGGEQVQGCVRLTCSEAVLQALVAPALGAVLEALPGVELRLHGGPGFANLSRHEADIAVRLCQQPPQHLVGRPLATVPFVLCAHPRLLQGDGGGAPPWIALEEGPGEDPTGDWRRQHFPAARIAHSAHGLHGVAQLARAGLGRALLPRWLIEAPLQVLDEPTVACASTLWLLMRPDCRHIPAVAKVFEGLARHFTTAANH